MTTLELQNNLYEFIKPNYPNIIIQVVENTDSKLEIYFTDAKFKVLYPKQRYHYLSHLIPNDFYDQNLPNTTWFELAPGESPDDLDYHDQETIDDIKEPILSILKNKISFINQLDNKFMSENVRCFGDFRYSKEILTALQFSDDKQFDIFHVLMNEGGFCDCEILYNVFKESKYAKKYWQENQ